MILLFVTPIQAVHALQSTPEEIQMYGRSKSLASFPDPSANESGRPQNVYGHKIPLPVDSTLHVHIHVYYFAPDQVRLVECTNAPASTKK